VPTERLSVIEGMHTITTAGDAGAQGGMGAQVYVASRSMKDEYFYNADGEMLFVPQLGRLRFWTEFGIIDAEPGGTGWHPQRIRAIAT
jgi:homogentisate 1,2-dioxygenase